MIKKKDLKILANKRIKDALILIKKRRYQGAMYIGGYAIEYLLKYNICKQFGLTNGFPEKQIEFVSYKKQAAALKSVNILKINDIRIHDLVKLLKFSGKQLNVFSIATAEWNQITNVFNWNPEKRYLNYKVNKSDAKSFINAVEAIKNILI